jgi:hypothetical protein
MILTKLQVGKEGGDCTMQMAVRREKATISQDSLLVLAAPLLCKLTTGR